ncbi:hypothetical protein [Mangrovibacterium diazotrophicum]|uniref:Uncharacterized protein n=1 Tax=Mangrovibacterium diazotrophicum TaxID=1261403 RepID=A0A419W5D7_9BACT|nr:hypothetical protein [Mangrovibacterium diazotrophicum]RKD90646.1 hypothetical protein BC643_0987 [Mangrovibacterium diazotrophicum]
MKNKIVYLVVAVTLMFTACDPIEDRNDAGEVLTEAELLNYMDVTVNGNVATCTNNAPGVISFWKTDFGQQMNANSVDFYIPVAKTYTATLIAYCAGGPVTATKEFTIAENDPEYFADPFWNMLTNGTEGKSWVWATDIPGGKIWGNGGYLASLKPEWWALGIADVAGQGGSATDEITFDLNEGLNFAVTGMNAEDPVPGNGSGTFNMSLGDDNHLMNSDGSAVWSYGKMVFTNHTIPLGFEPNSSGKPLHYKFDILKLTEDELQLAFPEPGVTWAWGTAWFYMFKRKGYTY